VTGNVIRSKSTGMRGKNVSEEPAVFIFTVKFLTSISLVIVFFLWFILRQEFRLYVVKW
jgi:hypothetical protein